MHGIRTGRIRLVVCTAAMGFMVAVQPASAAATPGRVEVLGIHYGDSWASAVDKLHAAGLREGVSAHNLDNRMTWEQYVQERGRRRTEEFFTVERFQWFQDASGRGVELSGLVTKAGYVVREVNYTFHADGGMPAVIAGLKAKFGAPRTGRERRFGGSYSAFLAPGDRPGVALVAMDGMMSPVLDLAMAFGPSDVVATRHAIDAEAAAGGAGSTQAKGGLVL